MVSMLGFSQDSNQNSESNFNVEFLEHKVKRKQTLYTISNLYNVPIDLIKKYNPVIKGNKISKKMVLKIPFITSVILKKSKSEVVKKEVLPTKKNQNIFLDQKKSLNLIKKNNFFITIIN